MSLDRDRILEQALTHELKRPDAAVGPDCLDAETLGAWADGGLDRAAMAACEAHISNCARCQSLVAAMARSTPATESAAGSWPLWRWWLAPIAAGAAAVTLWMVVPEQPQVAVTPTRPSEPTAAAGPIAEATRAERVPAEPVPQRDAAPAEERADRQLQKLADARAQVAPKQEAMALESPAPAAAALEAAAAPPAPSTPPAPAATAPAVADAPAAGALQRSARSAVATIEIPTPQASVRWRIAGDSFIELTDTGGATWQRKQQLPGAAAGSALSASVCWLAGANGAVWLTTDGGASFSRVGLAEPLDLAAISATDARTAVVTTVTGRRFRTVDAGRTWTAF